MKKKYRLEGLDCANCAEKIRYETEQLESVDIAEMNFMKKELIVTVSDKANHTKLSQQIEKIVKRLEPDVQVFGGDEATPIKEQSYKSEIVRLIISVVIFGTAFAVEKLADIQQAFDFPYIFITIMYAVSYILVGFDVLKTAFKNILRGNVFDENFLMSIASIGAICLGQFEEAVAVMVFYNVGELFQSIAVNNSRKSITSLMNVRPEYANLLVNGEYIKVAPDTVEIGDEIQVKPGEKIPLDCEIITGTSALDTSALTGESVPRDVSAGDNVLGGMINISGVLTMRVTSKFGDSAVSKMLKLVENAVSKKAKTENFITKFARYYTPIVVICAVILALVPPIFVGEFPMWIERGLIFLVISCPCALVISIPLSFFGGIGKASKNGILVKGSNYLETLNNVDTVVFDKTGTLTQGVFKVNEIHNVDIDENKLLELAAYAESNSSHPIAVSIREKYALSIDNSRISDYKEIAGKGISAVIDGVNVLCGNSKLMQDNNISCIKVDGTNLQVAVDGEYKGYITISDQLKQNSVSAIASLKRKGISRVIMLTGDNAKSAEKFAKEMGITEVHSDLLPQDKSAQLDKIKSQLSPKSKLAFVGDGINDSPVLAAADVGISMGGLGSDSAIEASDIVLMNDDPAQLVTAIDIAKATRRIVVQNIVFALGVKLVVQILGVLGIATMWEAVFADVGVSILAILNSMRLMYNKKK